jgi:hypothetical protein
MIKGFRALRKKLEFVSSQAIKAKDESPERPRLLRKAAKLLSEVQKAQNRSADQGILPE